MNENAPISTFRREYPLKAWIRGLYLVLGFLVGAVGAVSAILGCSRPEPDASLIFLALAPSIIGGYLVLVAVRSRLVIDGSRIEVQYAVRRRSADRSEIVGFHKVSTRNGSYRRLFLNNGQGPISVAQTFEEDGDLREWFQQLKDLDEAGREKLLDEISQTQELGATREERLGALKTAKLWNIGLTVVAIAGAAGLNIGDADLRIPAAIVLGAIPLVLVYLVRREPLLCTVFKAKRDPRTDLLFPLLVSSFGLLLRCRGIEFVSMKSLGVLIVFAALAGLWGFATAVSGSPQFLGASIGLLMFAGMYGYGLAALADTLPDHSAGVPYVASVTGKHRSSGRTTSYILELGPWGPVEGPNHVSVPYEMYGRTSVGDSVCLELHPGALHAAWYRRIRCEGVVFPPAP